MTKVLIVSIINGFSGQNHYMVDDTTVVESIDQLNTYIRDNRDDTMDITFQFYFVQNQELDYNSSVEEQMQELNSAPQISHATALLLLCNKVL